MKRPLVVLTALIIAIGGTATYLVGYGNLGAPSIRIPGSASTASAAAITKLNPNGVPLYGCSYPAVSSQLDCATLPAGYSIAPRLPSAPPPFCLQGMNAAACALLKQTQSNGVCDPNETPQTDPIDCGCTGMIVSDPYLGRCANPATVCQLAADQVQAGAAGPEG